MGVQLRFIGANELADVGASSAQHALHTLNWAIAGGDLDLVESLLHLPPTTRARMEELLGGLSAEDRRLYSTPERLAAALLAMQKPVRSYLVSQDSEIASGVRKLVMRTTNGTGKSDAVSYEFRLNAVGSWQRVVTLQQANRWGDVLGSDLYRTVVAGAGRR